MPQIGALFPQHLGIETITHISGQKLSGLPDIPALLPSGTELAGGMTESLYEAKLTSMLRNFLAPAMQSKELLLPGMLNQKLKRAKDDLRNAGRKKKSKALHRAADLLEEDAELKEVLDTYRQLLQKG